MLKIIFTVLFIAVEQDSQGRLTFDEVIQQLMLYPLPPPQAF